MSFYHRRVVIGGDTNFDPPFGEVVYAKLGQTQ